MVSVSCAGPCFLNTRIAEFGSAALGFGKSGRRPFGNHFPLVLSHSRKNVNGKAVGSRHVAGNKIRAVLHQSRNKRNVAGEPGGSVIVGAQVRLTNDISKQVREYKTDSNGNFEFGSILPGGYSLKIIQPGFKAYEQQNVTVSAQERVDVHTIHLSVGDVSSSVEVQAEAAHVGTDNSDRSQNVNLRQIQDTPVRGRDFLGVLKTLPGVQDLGNHDSRGWGGNVPTINGGQQGQVVVTLDGFVSQDSGAPSINGYIAPSVDAIGEVKLLVSNYTAEYGARKFRFSREKACNPVAGRNSNYPGTPVCCCHNPDCVSDTVHYTTGGGTVGLVGSSGRVGSVGLIGVRGAVGFVGVLGSVGIEGSSGVVRSPETGGTVVASDRLRRLVLRLRRLFGVAVLSAWSSDLLPGAD